MLVRILVAVVLLPVVIALMIIGKLPFALFVALITAVAAWELVKAVNKLPTWLYVSVSLCAGVIAFCFYFGLAVGLKVLGFAAVILMTVAFGKGILSYQREDAVTSNQIISCLFAGVLMPAMMSSLTILNSYGAEGFSRQYLVLAIGLAFITDAGAYFVGMFLGKHRGITQVSPKKSAEGFVGGLVVGALFAVVVGLIISHVPSSGVHVTVNYLYLCIYGVVGALVTEVGDLAFSLIKREYGIKDYGKLLPGHGGMMDRFDSMVFCAPVVMLFSQCIPAFFL